MTPAGYLYKIVASRPDWLGASAVIDICSISGCISRPVADFIRHWTHNGYWLFNSPAVMDEIAKDEHIDLLPAKLFYYEVHEEEFDDRTSSWRKFEPETSFVTRVHEPRGKRRLGYDVATFYAGAARNARPSPATRSRKNGP